MTSASQTELPVATDELNSIEKIKAHADKHRKSGRATFSIAGIDALLARLEQAEVAIYPDLFHDLMEARADYLSKLAEEHRQTADMAEALAKCQREIEEFRSCLATCAGNRMAAERLLASQADEIRRKDEALRLAVAYDDILLRFKGPAVIFDGDVPVIDAAYDKWVSAARAALLPEGKPREPEGEV